jgi:NADP-dependent 3-hydroxy acid dehydrogenase YdfG
VSTETRKVLLLGAMSGVARALIPELRRAGWEPVLAARDPDRLETVAGAAGLARYRFDAVDFDAHAAFVAGVTAAHDLDGVLIAFGVMHPQAAAERDWHLARAMIDTNFAGAVSVLNLLAPWFEARGQGFIGVITSVAGDRGRKRNALYGATKAGLNTYLAGLRHRLAPRGVLVQTIKLGPTDTPMNRGLAVPVPLTPAPVAARLILRALRRRRAVVYVPGRWRWIMLVIRLLPDALLRRLDL